MANIKDRYKGSHNTANLRTNIYERRVLTDTTPGTLRNKTLTSALYKWHYDNGLFDSIKFLWAGEAGIRLDASAVKRVTKLYSFEQYNQIIPRRNLLTYTEEFDNAAWTKLNVTVTPNALNNHLGVNSADLITENTGNGYHLPYQSSFSYVSGTTYTLSIYVKPNGRTKLAMGSGNVTIWKADATFDTVAMTATPTQVGCTASIIDVGSGWYRLSVTGTAISSQVASVNIIVLLNNSGATSYTGDGTSGAYIWGAQLEIGSTPTAYQRVIDANSWDGLIADASQGTFTNQPFLSGHIAPNETYCLKNVNGGSAYMTHPTISFAANQAWSVTFCPHFFIQNNIWYVGYQGGANNLIGISGLNKFTIYFNDGSSIAFNNYTVTASSIIGKTHFYTVTNDSGVYKLYIDGAYIDSNTISGKSINFARINKGFDSGGAVPCIENLYSILSAALTATQVQSLHNTIRSFIPEIPSVVIGGQTWATSNLEMVATPMGNLIANVTADATWATSTTLYTNAYNAATGTEEQKVYAGVKAAAMWCHYGNVADNGAIYGKLYNWYAAKLLQMDIDYYNTANPTTPWGWRVPTSTDVDPLIAYLGGSSVAGDKLKLSGTTYWLTGNNGDNSSGFSALPSGLRGTDGVTSNLNSQMRMWLLDASALVLTYNLASTGYNAYDKIRGHSIRLIKN